MYEKGVIMNNYSVTEREKDVLTELVKGKTNKEIADTLYISRSTVKAHLEKLFYEFKVSNRVQLALVAVKNGIVPLNII